MRTEGPTGTGHAGPAARPRRRRARALAGAAAGLLVLALVALLAASCSSFWLPGAIISSPNRGDDIDAADDCTPEQLRELKIAFQGRVSVGPPLASLSYWVLDPRASQGLPAATVLVLHGIRDDKEALLGAGQRLAARGFRAVLVDLRGHGRSSGNYLTYGVVEAVDLSQLIDRLEAQGLLAGRLGALGHSYGGAVALQLAAADDRVAAVAAVATFESLEKIVPHYVRRFFPAWLVPDSAIGDALRQAGRQAGFDPAAASPVLAAAVTRAPILLIHGREDRKIPVAHSEAVNAAAGGRGRLIVVEGEGHDSIMADEQGIVLRETAAWFKRWLE